MRVLIASGADVNAICKRGRSVLHWALRSDSAICCKVLLDAGADVNLADNGGWTVLTRCICFVSEPEEIVEMLLHAGADMNFLVRQGMNALMHDVMIPSSGPFEKILQRGADIEIRKHAGRTAVFHAVDCNNHFVISLLINLDASLSHLDEQGNSIIHYAAAFATLKTMGILGRSRIIEIRMDNAAIVSYPTSFSQREKCALEQRAPHEQKLAAFRALLKSVIPYQFTRSSHVTRWMRIPSAFPVVIQSGRHNPNFEQRRNCWGGRVTGSIAYISWSSAASLDRRTQRDGH